jgi:hypothetical protein
MKAPEIAVRAVFFGTWGVAIVVSTFAWGVKRLLNIEVP